MAESQEAAARARLSAEAEKVMNESKPTPTQAEVDAIKTGTMDHDDKTPDENPSMRPLHEQHAMIEEAKQADQKAVTADSDQPRYRTRAMTPRTGAQADHNDPLDHRTASAKPGAQPSERKSE